jgi:hypothetical protein
MSVLISSNSFGAKIVVPVAFKIQSGLDKVPRLQPTIVKYSGSLEM